MKITTLGGSPPTCTIEGTEEEIRALAPLLMRAVSVAAVVSWTEDQRHEWEESIAKLDGITVVDVDDWCQSKDKPVAERAGVDGRARMLAYFTSAKGGDSVRAYIAQKKPATNAGA